MRTSILLCLVLALAACFQPEPDGDDGIGGASCPTFSCSSDADCLQGFVCSHGACSMPVSCGELPSQCPQDGYAWGLNDCLWSGCDCWFNDQTPTPPPPPPPPSPPPQDSCGESATCTTALPACPAGQIPELQDGCYTGACRAIDGCDVPPACTALTHEDDCTARADCEPLYTGLDCTDASGNACTMGDANCTCKEFDFSSCAAK